MIGLKSIFPPSTLEDWIVQLKKDLKGEGFDKLLRKDEVEEINYPTYHHAESNQIIAQSPGEFPYTRGPKTTKNDWSNGHLIRVESVKSANQKALDLLMKGCDLLIFDIQNCSSNDWKSLFQEIQFEFIKVQLLIENKEQFESLQAYFGGVFPSTLRFNYDFIEMKDEELFLSMLEYSKKRQLSFCYVNGFSIQQCGATSWQEIAFCISTGHEYLVKLMQNGLTIDQAVACIHFSIGIGSNYFLEIAKIRAVKQVWASIIKEYSPLHANVYNCSISAQIGFMNKSLIDPHTNLLRQTTETMSASTGGVDSIIVHPYDSISENGTSTLAERMALNISLILKEESYFDGVIDPLGGSYAIEDLTQKIGMKSWELFQRLEEKGGIFSADTIEFFKNAVEQKAELRRHEIIENKKTLIGINKYRNNAPETNNFKHVPDYLGMRKLIFERELIATK